MEVARVPPGRL